MSDDYQIPIVLGTFLSGAFASAIVAFKLNKRYQHHLVSDYR
jgi:hypothetical protein